MYNMKKEIPNCALCKWRGVEYDIDDKRVIYNICTAIGCKLCVTVHNKKLCKQLYFKER